ncbi:poly(A)-specific ribonuclease PARN-like protein [Tanacetum coccineum]
MLRKRFLSTQTQLFTLNPKPQNTNIRRPNWPITQVTKSNFTNSVTKLNNLISDSDYIAVSLQKTGTYSSPWHRILPFDTAETAYLKAKYAAEKFQIFQLAVCPFSVKGSTNKIIAHPEQESASKHSNRKSGGGWGVSFQGFTPQSSSSRSVADNVFIERIKSRIGNWINACKHALVNSLRKLILGGEDYGSRPSLNIDVCSERQVQLVFEMVKSHYENVVPLTITLKGGGTQAVRVVLTSSKEDRDLLEKELQDVEEEQSKRVRGFREVIDLISTSQKPVIAHNSLNDFTFIHSKFLSPLPPTTDEFRSSLHSAFPNIIDVSHLMKGIGPLNKYSNLLAAISYLKKHFFAPIEIVIPKEASMEESKNHGHNVVRISELFAKLCFIQKITPETELRNSNGPSTLKHYSNVFNLDCNDFQGSSETDDISVWTQNPKKISINKLVFLWGFRSGISAGKLKVLLGKSHDMLSEDHVFDVRLVDKSCAVVVFWKNGVSEWFLNAINSGDGLRELAADGMMAAGYEAYKKVCKSEVLGMDLADSLGEIDTASGDHKVESAEVYWNSELMINFDDL